MIALEHRSSKRLGLPKRNKREYHVVIIVVAVEIVDMV